MLTRKYSWINYGKVKSYQGRLLYCNRSVICDFIYVKENSYSSSLIDGSTVCLIMVSYGKVDCYSSSSLICGFIYVKLNCYSSRLIHGYVSVVSIVGMISCQISDCSVRLNQSLLTAYYQFNLGFYLYQFIYMNLSCIY